MATLACGVLLDVAEWTLGIRRAEVKPSAFPGPSGQGTKGLWNQVAGRWTGRVIIVESAPHLVLLLPVFGITSSLPCSKPAQERVYLIVAAGLAVGWLWLADVSRQDTGLAPGLASAVGKVCPADTGPRGTEPADHIQARGGTPACLQPRGPGKGGLLLNHRLGGRFVTESTAAET